MTDDPLDHELAEAGCREDPIYQASAMALVAMLPHRGDEYDRGSARCLTSASPRNGVSSHER